MGELRKLVPRPASYVWETDYFEPNWQDSLWGDNYARLKRIKEKYDPTASSSSITTWAARTGAPTDSTGSKLAKARESNERPGPQGSHRSGSSAPANVDLVS
jgi:hypothetical protein